MLTLTYREHTAEIEFDWVELHWLGHAVDTDDSVSFFGATVEEAEHSFHEAISAYLASHGELGEAA